MLTTQARRNTVNVLCVDDHAVVAEGLQAFLASAFDITCVGRLASAEDLVNQVKTLHADIVLMDIEMSGADVFEAVEDLGRQCPDTKVIILSAHVRDHYIDAAVQAGAWGYLCKTDEPASILEAIRKVAHNEFAFSPQVLERCEIQQDGRGSRVRVRPASRLQGLSPRETQEIQIGKDGIANNRL